MLVDCIILDCTYSVKITWVESYYHCQARIIAVGHERNISEVSSNHLAGYNNLNVSSIDFSHQVVRLPPRNIEAFFPNLACYRLFTSQTEVIHPNDINKLPELKYYMCQTNPKVTKIPPNMFADNPKLAGIAFNSANQIHHVAYNVFDHLDKLTYLYIEGPCINLAVANNRPLVVSNLFNIFKACPPSLEMLNEQLSQRNCNCWGKE